MTLVGALLRTLLFVFLPIAVIAMEHPYIRVRLANKIEQVSLTGSNIQIRGRESRFEKVSFTSPTVLMRIQLQKFEKELRWKIQSSLGANEILSDSYLAITGKNLRLNGKKIPNQILLTKNSSAGLIGFVPMNEYLYGVLAHEMPANWPLETLKAQAIAARSYALAVKQERKTMLFDVDRTFLDQVYDHLDATNLASELKQKVRQAVDETEGLYLLSQNLQPVKTYYHADCGGRTTSSASVFGTNELVASVADASCPLNPKATWSYRISKKNFLHKMGFKLGQNLSEVQAIESVYDEHKTRAEKVSIAYGQGRQLLMLAQDFRQLLGFVHLRSTQFLAEIRGDEILFYGKGFGHGVGLCQWGSKSLGQKGKNYDQILRHYYPSLRLHYAKNLQGEKSDGSQSKHLFN